MAFKYFVYEDTRRINAKKAQDWGIKDVYLDEFPENSGREELLGTFDEEEDAIAFINTLTPRTDSDYSNNWFFVTVYYSVLHICEWDEEDQDWVIAGGHNRKDNLLFDDVFSYDEEEYAEQWGEEEEEED